MDNYWDNYWDNPPGTPGTGPYDEPQASPMVHYEAARMRETGELCHVELSGCCRQCIQNFIYSKLLLNR